MNVQTGITSDQSISSGVCLILYECEFQSQHGSLHGMVIIPFFIGSKTGLQAAIFSFIFGVTPPMAMLGRTLLYVQSQCVAWSWASSIVANKCC